MFFLTIFLTGILYRIVFFIQSVKCLPISTDEAYIGLVAKSILHGKLPLVSFGVGYQGPLESYLNVPILYFLNPSPFSIRILTLLGSIIFLLLVYKLGKDIFGKKVGLLSILFTAIPPAYFLMAGSLSIAPYNYTLLIFGTIILILANKLVYYNLKSSKEIFYSALLGFLSGVMFWVSMIIVYYLIPVVIFLFLKDKLFFLRKRTIIGFIFFCMGSLPLWIYNFSHNFESFLLGRSVPLSEMFLKLKVLFTFTLPAILGLHTPFYIDNTNFVCLPYILAILYSIVLFVTFTFIIITSLKGITRIMIFSLRGTSGSEMLLLFLAVTFIIFAKSDRSNWWALRYLEPIFSVIPVLLAYGIYKISRYSKITAVIFSSIILITNIYSGVSIYKLWGDSKIVEEKLELPSTKELTDFLQKEGINRGYAHYWTAYRMTFETDEKIIISPPYDERFGKEPPYLDTVAVSPNVAYIFQKGLGRISADIFECSLKIIKGGYKRKEINSFTIFYSFRSPCGADKIEKISRDNWTLDANYKKEDANCAKDGDLDTRWGSGTPQVSGMYFLLDLGEVYEVCKIRIDLGRFTTDSPRAYKVEVSADGIKWEKVAENQGDCSLFWEGNQPRFLLNDYFNICFMTVQAMYIKITQTGRDPRFDWSIAEINVYGVKS